MIPLMAENDAARWTGDHLPHFIHPDGWTNLGAAWLTVACIIWGCAIVGFVCYLIWADEIDGEIIMPSALAALAVGAAWFAVILAGVAFCVIGLPIIFLRKVVQGTVKHRDLPVKPRAEIE